jgi:hypothetical protein
VRKSWLKNDQMSSVDYVERAALWSRELTRFRARGPGDLENAMRSVERDYCVEGGVLWRLRYRVRQIKDIGISVYARLEAAYFTECERQQRKLQREIQRVTQLGVAVDRETEGLVGEPSGETEL